MIDRQLYCVNCGWWEDQTGDVCPTCGGTLLPDVEKK